MRVNTKLFGEIEIDDNKVIHFDNGIIGFPDLKNFTLIYDEENEERKISWLQSLEEPGFALVVVNPQDIVPEYNPFVNDEFLKPLGDINEDNICVLVTLKVPTDIKKMAVNLKAPIVINVEERKAAQLIVEDDYPVCYEIYDLLKHRKDGGEE